MNEQDFEYPEDYQSPESGQEKSDGNTQEKEKEQQEVKKSKKDESKSSQQRPPNKGNGDATLDEKEKAAMKWLNEGNALQPLLDDPPQTRQHKGVLYELANRL